MRRWPGLAFAALLWFLALSPALAQEMVMSGSRYSAPLWAWVTAIVVAAALGMVGMAIGLWFLRKRARIESSD